MNFNVFKTNFNVLKTNFNVAKTNFNVAKTNFYVACAPPPPLTMLKKETQCRSRTPRSAGLHVIDSHLYSNIVAKYLLITDRCL